jgi:nitrite reductase/ring-hydroxylating ferredoxin subunit
VTTIEQPARATTQPTPGSAGFAPTLNPEYPTAWWVIALSGEVGLERVVPVRALERDLVIWRDHAGLAHCHAAHCLHLGSHLGYGGVVSNGTLQCPFHGWSYNSAGKVAAQVGPARPVDKLCLPTYRVKERDGVVYLWNGGGEPDHELPDYYDYYGVSPERYVTIAHRLYLPFPAKYFAENICDGMHLAFAHGAAEWGEAVVLAQTATVMRIENRLHGLRPWYTWQNAKRLYRQGEFVNMLTPVRGSLFATSYGATIHLTHIENTGNWGNHVVCWTPVNEDDHHFFAIDVVPRPRGRFAEPALRTMLTAVLRRGLYSTAAQDVALLRHRSERPKPPYARFDKGLIAFRRFWDSRIESPASATGDGIHSNGTRAGIGSGSPETGR